MKTLSESGYVFNFSGHGAFDPDGKLEDQPSAEAIEAHNEALSAQEMAAMRETGRGILYLFKSDDSYAVGTWASQPPHRAWVCKARHSRNNMGAQRTDVWFIYANARWHGVNLGDNDIVRCKRLKNQSGTWNI